MEEGKFTEENNFQLGIAKRTQSRSGRDRYERDVFLKYV